MPKKMSGSENYLEAFPALLEAFVQFLHATGRLPDAGPLLKLAEEAKTKLPKLAADPANWGLAKGFFMSGKAAGYDMSTQSGIDSWMQEYNAGLQAFQRDPEPAPPQ